MNTTEHATTSTRSRRVHAVTEAAVELLNEVGLAELTTRRLAAKLGVRSPTLYWHVRNKAELLDLVAEAICADAFDIDETQSWRDQLADGLRQFRELLLRHRDAAELLRERPPQEPRRLGQNRHHGPHPAQRRVLR
ncbi:TetR family transcriptional regulator [Allokutzneria sp. A3M-2-11 16]|uniref:TetR family transcriptional regulator n=1 Tax=Allokutzneria sp. A3M-2-11 16 TaxID=2962043 RepID=UPI0020B86C5F|nr:TetR family transcriptional regulator [Allokutzneria sp. A3M-2-11 16]MCP3800291.1 TetR family transcriptional regulator [Allokutzneria sp. A3M-2-11 16]